tara:strand:+ start:704 stop:901 length:198 start_codon:yes stop_codon:yes gene_type:complete
MKVLATRNVIASGQALDAGKTYDISEADAALLIRMGKVIEATAEVCPPIKPKAPKKPKVKVDGDS